MKMNFFFLFLLGIASQHILAADGSSGCGPGWYLFKENSLVSSSFRSTTNGFLFPVVTFGMTFGTSNCTQHKLVLKEKESLYFATMNYFELKRDITKGEGEYLAAFSSTMGCPQSIQSYLNQKLKANYSQIYNSSKENPETVLFQVYRTIFSDADLTAKCSLGMA
ncbi:MAG: DUF3015 domain-containing protein [Bdellovibrionales bacterium]|nr:DUF3015 domain-containing protein [Bdellovibrionales bacterium]